MTQEAELERLAEGYRAFGNESLVEAPIYADLAATVARDGDVLATSPQIFLTAPHVDGHAVVLRRLSQVSAEVLAELVGYLESPSWPAPL